VLQLISQSFQRILDKTATGLTAKGIKAAKLKRLPITVPPLAEQQRIVAKVDELMALCDQIEAQLTATQTDSRRLLEAVLEAALAGNSMASG
jgi:type I restriction enzyme S subunit